MRWLLLLALAGMGFSRFHFGSAVPPTINLRAPGFTIGKDRASAKKPSWLIAPVHFEPIWLKQPVHREYAWMKACDARTPAVGSDSTHYRGQLLDK
jgi:hypothetical protein